jgi:hypothetical protein
MKLPDRLVDWIIRRARRTPYTHLRHADGRPYMDRDWFLRIGRSGPNRQYPWIGARVHTILSSDDDRALHDHPWAFVTIILRGGYVEFRAARDPLSDTPWSQRDEYVIPGGGSLLTPLDAVRVLDRVTPLGFASLRCRTGIGDEIRWVNVRRHRAGAILRRNPTDWHMLYLAPGETATTLFITLPQRQQWGFLVRGCKVPWREFERTHQGSGITATDQRGAP